MIYRGALAVKSKPCATADSATQQQDLSGTADTATEQQILLHSCATYLGSLSPELNNPCNAATSVLLYMLICFVISMVMLVAAALAMRVGVVLPPQDTKCLHVPTHAIQQEILFIINFHVR